MRNTLALDLDADESLAELFAHREPGERVRLVLDLVIDENTHDRVVGRPEHVELGEGEELRERPEPLEELDEEESEAGNAVIKALAGTRDVE